MKDDNKALGLTKGWTTKSIVELTESADFNLRGEEYSLQIDHFIKAVKNKNSNTKSSFESALVTDEVINQLIADTSNN